MAVMTARVVPSCRMVDRWMSQQNISKTTFTKITSRPRPVVRAGRTITVRFRKSVYDATQRKNKIKYNSIEMEKSTEASTSTTIVHDGVN